MDNLQTFKNNEFGEIRVVTKDKEPWFVGKDIAERLGYSETNAMTKRLDTEDFMSDKLEGMNMKSTLINESGLYSAILGSKLPTAKKFKRWVTSEVLPSIRKHGTYMTSETIEEVLLNPDTIIKIATALKEEQEKTKQLETVNSTLKVDNAIMAPKAEYFDDLIDRNLLTNFRTTAKQLQVPERKFIKELIDKKFIYRDKKGKLMPYAGKNDGLFEVKDSVNGKTGFSCIQTLITPKGKETFRSLFEGYIS